MEYENFKSFEEKAWERKASRYENTWGRVSSQVAGYLLDIVDAQAKERLLDIGCGPGDLCKEASARGLHVTGCDFSKAMIEIASRNHPGIVFEQQDAEKLSYEDASFDICTLNYLLLHVEDQTQALREAKRVLCTGGRLAYSMWCAPEQSPGLGLIFSALKKHADMSVIPPAQGIFQFSNFAFAKEALLALGFAHIEEHAFENVWIVKEPEEFFAGVQAGTRMGGLVELQSEEKKQAIREDILAGIESFYVGNEYHVGMPSLVVVAG
jgi:ubiquinone/menaquinone biosynthesis C-methylase UbiE